ncbi:hypothetical protein SERLADRAFT_393641, partial [Serpula lacrymans var. lacrymans S7.9]
MWGVSFGGSKNPDLHQMAAFPTSVLFNSHSSTSAGKTICQYPREMLIDLVDDADAVRLKHWSNR